MTCLVIWTDKSKADIILSGLGNPSNSKIATNIDLNLTEARKPVFLNKAWVHGVNYGDDDNNNNNGDNGNWYFMWYGEY